MIRVVQHQHGGFLLRLAWDPRTSWVDSLVVGTDGRVNFYYQEYISIGNWTGFLRGRFYVGWTEPLQYLIDLLIGGLQEVSCISTLQISTMSRECFTSSKQARDRFTWRGFADDVGGDMGECTTCQQSRLGHTHPT
jgi:hypothetical protein